MSYVVLFRDLNLSIDFQGVSLAREQHVLTAANIFEQAKDAVSPFISKLTRVVTDMNEK